MIELERGPADGDGGVVPSPYRPTYAGVLARISLAATALIFVTALLTLILWPELPITIDEDLWMRRGPTFIVALLENKLADTFQRQHPGVTNMWLIGGSLVTRYILRGFLPLHDLARDSDSLRSYLLAIKLAIPLPLELYGWVRSLVALVTAATLAGLYALGRRLFSKPVALIAVTILLFEPFFLAYQRSLTTDANQTNFVWLALLAYLLYLKRRTGGHSGLPWLLFSGAFFGLAVLSKVSALLSLPAIGLWVLAWTWKRHDRRAWLQTAVDLLLWALLAGLVVYLLWPALWSGPQPVLVRFWKEMQLEINGHRQFFLGESTKAPGPAFYPLVLWFRLSPLLLLGSALGVLALVLPALRRHLPARLALVAILSDVAIVLASLSISASKLDRYIVPILPGLAFLAAAGLWATLLWLSERMPANSPAAGRGTTARWLAAAVIGVLVAQLAVLLPNYPYNLTYFNPLAGGTAAAERALMIGNGELLDRAAVWLNKLPGATEGRVASFYPKSFEPYYLGKTSDILPSFASELANLAGANYVVLYANQLQRGLPPVAYFERQQPLFTVQAHGVDYARVYRGPSVSQADAELISHKTNLDFGSNARLVGYDLETPEVSAGSQAPLVLYWQAGEPFPSDDYVVRVALVDGSGNQIWGTHGVPVGGHLSVGQWEKGQVIRDFQQVTVPPGTPSGRYQVLISFYSLERQEALQISDDRGPHGEWLPLAGLDVR